MTDKSDNFQEDIKKYIQAVQNDKGIINMNELNMFISAHKGKLSLKCLREFARQNHIIFDCKRRTNKTHVIMAL